ncbi:MAG TPA: hypothetical protein VK208_20230 [Pyrinomonadaceae bacterium]|nr:hypothetical protein [Pyrinomonadaceae bacterium]
MGQMLRIKLGAILVLTCGALDARAQQTVFNVPSTDVLELGKAYFELDITAKPNNSLTIKSFSSFVPRFVAGVGGGVEIGLNVLGNIQPGRDTTTLVPAVKWRIYQGKDNGWTVAVGNNFYIPVRERSYRFGTFSYVTTQKTLTTKTRLGFGGHLFSRQVAAPNAIRAGGQFTLEQTLTDKLNLNADWMTGKHANGYFTSGLSYKLTGKLTGLAAYSIGNADARKGNHFAYLEIGYNFN